MVNKKGNIVQVVADPFAIGIILFLGYDLNFIYYKSLILDKIDLLRIVLLPI